MALARISPVSLVWFGEAGIHEHETRDPGAPAGDQRFYDFPAAGEVPQVTAQTFKWFIYP